MSADPYTTRASVLRRLPMGTMPSPSSLVASSVAGTDVVTLDGHGFETGDALQLRAVDGGTLSAPLVDGTTYYAIRLTDSTFKVAATVSGSAIDLTSSGIEMIVSKPLEFDYWIGVYSRWADTSLPGHLVPMGRTAAVPEVVESIVADLVAKRMFNVGGQASESLKDMEIASVAQLARFATGIPVRDSNATASANLAVTSTLASVSDPRGWAPSGSGFLP